MAPFEIVEHTADWALKISGNDLPDLLIQAALGMSTLMVGNLDELASAAPTAVRTVTLSAYDTESLLVGWLEELAFWAEMEQLVFYQFELEHVTPTGLRGIMHGRPTDDMEKHIKAVTYHNLAITCTDHGLETTVVFDV